MRLSNPSFVLYRKVALSAVVATWTACLASANAQVATCNQGSTGALDAYELLELNQNPQSVTIGDMNGDGVLDLVAGQQGSRIAILLGLGNGEFAAPMEIIAAEDVGAIVTGVLCEDLNADGVLDVVALSIDSGLGALTVLLGAGDGTMVSAAHYALPGMPQMITSGDLDGDGFADFVIPCASSGDVAMFRGSANGVLFPMTGIELEQPRRVAMGDLDGDLALDLVIEWNPTSPLGRSLSLYAGVGDGSFEPPVLLAQGSLGPVRATNSPLVVDLNADGVLDLVATGGEEGAGIRLGEGGGVLGPINYFGGPLPSAELQAADMNSDGLPDLVGKSSTDICVLLALEPGVFGLANVFNSTGDEFSLGDVDGDGAIDVVHEAGLGLLLLRGQPRIAAEDSLSPNHACANTAALQPGDFVDLVTFRGTAEDFFEIDVPSGATLSADVHFEHDRGDIDCYLYDAATVGSSCGDKMSFLVRGFSATDDESVSWTNTTGADQTYYLQVALWNSPSNADCNTYDLAITVSTSEFGSAMCAGDGSLIACPCDNESDDPAEGCLNSKDAGARIAATGTPVVANQDAVFHLSQGIPGDPALLVEGRSMMSTPFRDGIFCMGGFTTRVQAAMMDGDGNAATTGSLAVAAALVPGQTRYYQWWYRDPGGVSPCGTGSNFSAGHEVVWE